MDGWRKVHRRGGETWVDGEKYRGEGERHGWMEKYTGEGERYGWMEKSTEERGVDISELELPQAKRGRPRTALPCDP